MKVFELLPRPLGNIFRKLTHLPCNSPKRLVGCATAVECSLSFPFRLACILALSMRVVFSPNGTHPFDMGDFSVLAPARRTRVRLRGAVLLKSPHLKRLRSAMGANKRRRWHYRHRSTSRFVALHSLRYFVSAPPAAIIAETASPCFVARLRFRLTRT